MTDTSSRRIRRPGDKVVRRRVEAQQVMQLPPPLRRREPPTLRSNARKFALAYALLMIIGSLLLATPYTAESRDGTPIVDAVFTAISATSVTGLVTVDTQAHWNLLGESIILLLIQLGGMGFMVGASLVLLTIRRSATLHGSLILRDGAPTISLHEARKLARRVVRFILVTELIGAVILTIEFYPKSTGLPDAVWQGMFHSISAFCNAGFDLQGGFDSLYGFRESTVIDLTIVVLVQMGALSYMVFGDLWEKRTLLRVTAFRPRRFWQRLSLDTKLILATNGALIAVGAAAFAVVEWQASLSYITQPYDRAFAALFQSVSARTAGFATIQFADAHAGTLFIWIGLMMVGGASGSMAGGVKLATFAVVVLTVLSTVRGQTEPQIAGRRIPVAIIFRAMTLIGVFMMTHFVLTLMLVLTEDAIGSGEFSFLSLMFETMSGLSTVGVSTGLTPDLSTAGKVVLCLTMLVGRLGPLAAVYALQRRQTPKPYQFPEAWVRMG